MDTLTERPKAIYRCGNKDCRSALSDTWETLVENKIYYCNECGYSPVRGGYNQHKGLENKSVSLSKKNHTAIGTTACVYCNKRIKTELLSKHIAGHKEGFPKVLMEVDKTPSIEQQIEVLKREMDELNIDFFTLERVQALQLRAITRTIVEVQDKIDLLEQQKIERIIKNSVVTANVKISKLKVKKGKEENGKSKRSDKSENSKGKRK
jgi:hypothetical protein